jgi:hypothetical protein
MGDSTLWPIGIAIYVAGTVGEALGANLQRKAITDDGARQAADPAYESPGKGKLTAWKAGFFLFVFAGISMSLALFFSSQTLLAPLQLCLFLSNAIFANLMNKEPFAWLGADGLATLGVMVGILSCVLSAPKHADTYSDDQMLELMKQWGFISFCCGAFSLIVTIYFTKSRLLRACDGDPTKIASNYRRTVLNMSYGALAGAFGGVNVTLTKTTFSLMGGEFEDDGVWGVLSSPVLWCVSAVLVGTYIMQIKVTVDGLEETSAIIVISTHSVTEEVVASLGGILYFQDYKKFGDKWPYDAAVPMFICGNLLAVFSVVILSHMRLSAAGEKGTGKPAGLDGEQTPMKPEDRPTSKENSSQHASSTVKLDEVVVGV